jgi:hypothetical protein
LAQRPVATRVGLELLLLVEGELLLKAFFAVVEGRHRVLGVSVLERAIPYRALIGAAMESGKAPASLRRSVAHAIFAAPE